MKSYFSFLMAALLLTAVSCQQDEFLNELKDSNPTLKSYSLIGDDRYQGTYSGGDWLISLPENWNNTATRYMIFYAHGMVDPDEPVELPDDVVGGKPIEQIVNEMGMGYATTSYRENGLVAFEAVEDIKNLVNEVNQFFSENSNEYLPPDYLFLGGPSEGGLVTVLTIERYPDLFDGALSICGPIGDFYRQLQYNGDFNVLFNYFFEDILADKPYYKYIGDPLRGVGDTTMTDWKTGDLKQVIQVVMAANPSKVRQLLKCAKVTVDMNDLVAMGTAVLECLRFNIMLTNDVTTRLQGVPFNNKRKWYWGSDNDWRLNRNIQRVLTPDYYTAKNNINKYQTSGEIEIPVVTIHTTGDHVTPFWHNPIYRLKTFLNGNSLLHSGIPVVNYGHCTIEESHLIAALAILIIKTGFINRYSIDQSLFANKESLESFKQIMKENSVEVEIN